LRWLQSAAPDFRFQSEQVVRVPLPASVSAEARLAWLKKLLQELLADGSM
jgi:hypothetical protein